MTATTIFPNTAECPTCAGLGLDPNDLRFRCPRCRGDRTVPMDRDDPVSPSLIPAYTLAALNHWRFRRPEGRCPGGFITAVLEGDWMRALHHADTNNLKAMAAIMAWMFNYMPSGAWGSKEKVATWYTR